MVRGRSDWDGTFVGVLMVRSFVGLRITTNGASGVRYVYVSALRRITINGATRGGTVPAAKCQYLPNTYEFLW